MKISVITACYNAATHLGATLRSIDSQTWTDHEHVVVDGGSADLTLAVLASHRKSTRHVVSEPDAGIYDAMNKGLARATGDVIGFLNADDMLAGPGVLAAVAEAFEADPAIDVLFGDLDYVKEDNAERVVRRWRSGEFAPGRLRRGWMPPHPTFYVRRRVVARVGGFDTRYRISADYDFMLRCLAHPGVRAHYLRELMVRMRLGGVSNSSIRNLVRKSSEDLLIMRRQGVGGVWNLFAKNVRKLPQLVWRTDSTG